MTQSAIELADRIKVALSGEINLTGEPCKHGYDRAICPLVECDNPYAMETLLSEAEALLRQQAAALTVKDGSAAS